MGTPSAEQAYLSGSLGSDAPPPAALCDHVMAMMQREVGPEVAIPPGELEQIRGECIDAGEQDRATIGEAAYREQASCILAAQSFDDIERCESSGSGSGSLDPEAVCDHVIDLMLVALGDQAAQMPRSELLEIRDNCIASARSDRAADAAHYEQQARCVLETRRLEDLDRCEDEQAAPAGPASARDLQMCEHIVAVLERETVAAQGLPLSPEDRGSLVDTCIADFQAERRELGDAAAEAMIDCVLAAADSNQMMACED